MKINDEIRFQFCNIIEDLKPLRKQKCNLQEMSKSLSTSKRKLSYLENGKSFDVNLLYEYVKFCGGKELILTY